MRFNYLNVQQDEGLVIATIENMENKNAVNDEMNSEIVRLARWMEDVNDNRVLILTGSGHIFCSGGNIRQMTAKGRALEPPPGSMREQLLPHEKGICKAVTALRETSKPVIAAINGHTVGSGIGLAAGCDIRIASEQAQFSWVFVRRGIVPEDASLALMIQLVGYANAFYWGVTGRTISAKEAKELGFCQEVVDHDDLLPAAIRLGREIIDACPPLTVELFKLVAASQGQSSLHQAMILAGRAQTISHLTDDHEEALRAYADKRTPVWRYR